MSRYFVLLISALVIVTMTASALPVEAKGKSSGTTVSATLQSYKIKLKKKSARRGTVRFKARNKSGTNHSICIRGKGVKKCSKVVGTGKRTTLKVKLRKKGRYTVYCSVGNHEELGMKTKFRVL